MIGNTCLAHHLRPSLADEMAAREAEEIVSELFLTHLQAETLSGGLAEGMRERVGKASGKALIRVMERSQETGLPPFFRSWVIRSTHGEIYERDNGPARTHTSISADIWEAICEAAQSDSRPPFLLQAVVLGTVLAARAALATPLRERDTEDDNGNGQWWWYAKAIFGSTDIPYDARFACDGVDQIEKNVYKFLSKARTAKRVKALANYRAREILGAVVEKAPFVGNAREAGEIVRIFQAGDSGVIRARPEFRIFKNPELGEDCYQAVRVKALQIIERDLAEQLRRPGRKRLYEDGIHGTWLSTFIQKGTENGWTAGPKHAKILGRIQALLEGKRKRGAINIFGGKYRDAADLLGGDTLDAILCLAQIPEVATGEIGDILDERTSPLAAALMLANSRGQKWRARLKHALDEDQHGNTTGVICEALDKARAHTLDGVQNEELIVFLTHKDQRIRDRIRRLLIARDTSRNN